MNFGKNSQDLFSPHNCKAGVWGNRRTMGNGTSNSLNNSPVPVTEKDNMALNPPSLAEIDPKLYVSLFETLQAPILFIDGQTGAILDANPAACVFYGYSHAEPN